MTRASGWRPRNQAGKVSVTVMLLPCRGGIVTTSRRRSPRSTASRVRQARSRWGARFQRPRWTYWQKNARSVLARALHAARNSSGVQLREEALRLGVFEELADVRVMAYLHPAPVLHALDVPPEIRAAVL